LPDTVSDKPLASGVVVSEVPETKSNSAVQSSVGTTQEESTVISGLAVLKLGDASFTVPPPVKLVTSETLPVSVPL
jgi:hypothetical protein